MKNTINYQMIRNHNQEENRKTIITELDRIIEEIESNTLNKSLQVAVDYYNRFERSNESGYAYWLDKCPCWIIARAYGI